MSTYRTTTIRDFIDDVLLGASALRVVDKLPELTSKLPNVNLGASANPVAAGFAKATGISNPSALANGVAHAASVVVDLAITDAAIKKLSDIPVVMKVGNAPEYLVSNTTGRIPVVGPALMEISADGARVLSKIADTVGLRGISNVLEAKERIFRKRVL